jgi:molybdopterin-guanine dinucleotide biosynthesis protein
VSAEDKTIAWPGMLLVGGAGRNSGKTTFSCSLIKRFCARHELVALKVTVIREAGGPCPRGNDSCGVCSSLSGSYEITEEYGDPPGKDTSLMVAAGAQRVYWMRVMREHLAEGVAALLQRVGSDAICICESNSLRHAVEPSVFLIVKATSSRAFKRSAREVLHLADRVVLSDGQDFDLAGDALEFRGGAWSLQA